MFTFLWKQQHRHSLAQPCQRHFTTANDFNTSLVHGSNLHEGGETEFGFGLEGVFIIAHAEERYEEFY